MKQNMNIVIPMAGRGNRFREAGYTDTKPFIDVNGKSMVHRVIENLNIEFDETYEFILICLKEDYEKYDFKLFKECIGHESYEVVVLDEVTDGATQTLLCAKDWINNDTPLLTLNSDQLVYYNPDETFELFEKFDGGIPCFYGKGSEKWSYAKLDDSEFVTEVAEKKSISPYATAGYYYWSKGSDFVKYAEQQIEHNDRTGINKEFYVAPVYNWAIKDGKQIVISMVDRSIELGTPEYLEKYLNDINIT